VDRRNGNCHIRLTGTLTDDTAHDLRYVMSALEKTNCNSKRVRLNLQNGLQSGSVGSAITVGAIIKNRGYDTQLQAGTTALHAGVCGRASAPDAAFFTTHAHRLLANPAGCGLWTRRVRDRAAGPASPDLNPLPAGYVAGDNG
jgi:hypothetical protein